jgi:hypothetical protein
MIVWLNGTFGAGKMTAQALHDLILGGFAGRVFFTGSARHTIR